MREPPVPQFVLTQHFPCSREVLFEFLRRPANVVAVAPPSFRLGLVQGPEVLALGDQVRVRSRRYGIATEVTMEVVELVVPESIVEVQRQGPFRHWKHRRDFVVVEEALTELRETIEYEPPGGLLGLTLTAARIEADLREAFEWRQPQILARLSR